MKDRFEDGKPKLFDLQRLRAKYEYTITQEELDSLIDTSLIFGPKPNPPLLPDFK